MDVFMKRYTIQHSTNDANNTYQHLRMKMQHIKMASS